MPKVPGDHVQPEAHLSQRLCVQPVPVCATVYKIRRFQLGATAEKEPAKLVSEITWKNGSPNYYIYIISMNYIDLWKCIPWSVSGKS